jgi:hypothetical protein
LQRCSDNEDAIVPHARTKIRAVQILVAALPCHDFAAAHDGNEEEWPAQAQVPGQCTPNPIVALSLITARTLDHGRQPLRQALRVALQLIELSPLHMGSLVQSPEHRAQEQEQRRDRGAKVFALLRQASSVLDFLVFGTHGCETLTPKQEPHRDVPVILG